MATLFLSSFLFAQQDSIELEDFPPDSLYIETDTCDNFSTQSSFSIRHSTHAEIYFRVDISDYSPVFSIHSSSSPSSSVANITVDTIFEGHSTSELVISATNVLLDQEYLLLSQNTCNFLDTIGFVSTSAQETSTLVLSESLMELLGKEHSYLNTYDLLEHDTTVIYEEKLSFVQKYFFDDSIFTPSVFTGVNPGEFPTNPSLVTDECECKFLTGEIIAKPGRKYRVTFEPPTGEVGFQRLKKEWTWFEDNEKSEYFHHLEHKGATRYLQNFSRGRRTGSKSTDLQFGGGIVNGNYVPSSPSVSRLIFNWYCVKGQYGSLESCLEGCEKLVHYEAEYMSRLITRVGLPSCFLCGNKGAKAQVEEFSALVLDDAKGKLEILAANRFGAASEASFTFNREWFVDYIGFAGAVVLAAVGQENVDIPELLEIIVERLGDLITNPIVYKDGANPQDKSCGFYDKVGSFSLKPNTFTRLSIYSSAHSRVSGYTSWYSEAIALGASRLNAFIYPGIGEASSEYCCSDGLGSWVMSAYDNSPLERSNLVSSTSAFYNAFFNFIPYNFTTWGIMNSPFACPSPDDPEEFNRGVYNDSQFDNKTPVRYQLFDINGRQVGETRKVHLVKSNTISIRKPEYSGLYFVLLFFDDGSYKTIKTFSHHSQPQNTIYVPIK